METLGQAAGVVALTSHHAAWAAEFESERALLKAALGGEIREVHHVGSTAIPGVPAKPILDILIQIENFELAGALVPAMEAMGYEYRGENGIPRRHYFVKGSPRTHHVHMLEPSHNSMLEFRDALRTDAGLAQEYADAKRQLARCYATDRAAYQQAKDVVVQRILGRISPARHGHA